MHAALRCSWKLKMWGRVLILETRKEFFGMTILRAGSFVQIIVSAVVLVLLAGCTTVPVTGRRELNFVSSDQEVQLGLSSFDQLKKDTPINHDPTINALV